MLEADVTVWENGPFPCYTWRLHATHPMMKHLRECVCVCGVSVHHCLLLSARVIEHNGGVTADVTETSPVHLL